MAEASQHSTLVLIPTELERKRLASRLAERRWHVELCGFGPIAAAAESARLIASHAPGRVLLLGVAGSYDGQQLPVGSAWQFESVACHGVGAGQGDEFVSARELGMAAAGDEMVEQFDLTVMPGLATKQQLLTVCSAAAESATVQQRRNRYPCAGAEDMESFGVAMACQKSNVPLTVVRGISNLAGDRDKRHWKIDAALDAVSALAVAAPNWF